MHIILRPHLDASKINTLTVNPMAFIMTETMLIDDATSVIEAVRQSADWLTPLPLVEKTIVTPYPIDALPVIIQNAITAYHQYGQQPIPLIACSALANVSLACQSLANIARDHYLITPVSLYLRVGRDSDEKDRFVYNFKSI